MQRNLHYREERADVMILPICLQSLRNARLYFYTPYGSAYGSICQQEIWCSKQVNIAPKKSTTGFDVGESPVMGGDISVENVAYPWSGRRTCCSGIRRWILKSVMLYYG